jgi:hypothetical protein
METLRSHKDSLILGFLFLWALLILFSIFYVISYVTTVPGALLLFCISLFGLFFIATRLATFPGAYSFWRKTLERSCMQSISTNLAKKLDILSLVLQCLQDNSLCEIYERVSLSTLQSVPRALERVVRNLAASESSTPAQQEFLQVLTALVRLLKEIKFTTKRGEESFYAFLVAPVVHRKVESVNCEQVKSAIDCIGQAYMMLIRELKQPETIRKMISWANPCRPVLLGSIDYMRNDVVERLKAEQVWVTASDGVQLDW